MTDIALRVQITGADRGAEATIRKVATAVEDLSAKSRASGAAAKAAVAQFSDIDVLPSLEEITAEIEKLIGVERAVEQVTRDSVTQYEAAEKALQRMGLSAAQVEAGLRKMGLAQERAAGVGDTGGDAAALNAQVEALDSATQARVRSIAATIRSANASTSEADALREALATQANVASVLQAGTAAEQQKAAAQQQSAASVSEVEVAQARLNRLRGLSTAQLQEEVAAVLRLPPAIRDEELAILELAGAFQRLESEQVKALATDRALVEQQVQGARAAEQTAVAIDQSAGAQRRNARAVDQSGRLQEQAGARTRRGAGTARTAIQQLVIAGTGLPGVLGRAAGALSAFAFGGGIAVAVVAGVGAIAAAWRSLTGDIRKSREEADQTATTLAQQALASRGLDVGRQITLLEDRRDELEEESARLERQAAENRNVTTATFMGVAREAFRGVTARNRQSEIGNELAEITLAIDVLRDRATGLREEVPSAISEAVIGRLQIEQQRVTAGAEDLVRVASIAFAAGRTSVDQFFEARSQALESGFAIERRIAEANADLLSRRAAVAVSQDPRTPAAIQAVAAAEQARLEIGVLQLRQDGQRNQLNAERIQQEREAVDALNELNGARLAAQGNLEAAALNDLELSLERQRRILVGAGKAADEIERRIASARTAGIAQARLDSIQRGVAAAFEETERLTSEVQARVDAGLITERRGRTEILAIERQRIPVLGQLRAQLIAVQSTLTDPAAIAAVRTLVTELDNATIAAGATGRAAIDLQLAFAEVVESELGTFLSQTVFEAKNAGDAFRSFASGVIDDINRIVSRIIAAEITSSVLGIATGGLGLASGGAVPQRLATGGLVYGPRYPVDRVPSWLTGGEYVFDTKSVGRAGLPFMRTLHAFLSGGLTPPAVIQRNRMPGHFAEGGIVNSGAGGRGGGSDRLRAEFDVSPDLVLRNLESTDGVRALVRIMASNPKTFNSALRG